MNKPLATSLSVLGFGMTMLLGAPAAQAQGLSSCGNIDVEARATCQVEAKGGCEAKCEPINFEAACAAELYAECNGECTASATVECTGECQADCEAECTGGSFDCQGYCEGRCDADCSAQCSGETTENGARGRCEARCEANCNGSCQGSCEVERPDCQGKCQASCQGSCKAEANADCHIDCDATGYAQCQAELTGGCKVQCQKPEGALFCDGEYVDAGNNLQECIDALRAQFDIEVTYSAEARGSANCANGTCEAEGEAEAEASCMMAPGTTTGAVFGWSALLALGAALIRRRR